MALHEQTIKEHVEANVSMAIDQAHEYDSLYDAMVAFLENMTDSIKEDGYSAEEAFDAGGLFVDQFNKEAKTDF